MPYRYNGLIGDRAVHLTTTQIAALVVARRGTLNAGNRYSIRTARALERAGLATVKASVRTWTNYRSKRTHSELDWSLTLTPEGMALAARLFEGKPASTTEQRAARPGCLGGPGLCSSNAVWKVKRTTDPDLPRMWSYACGRHLHWHASEELSGEHGRLDLVRIACDER